MEKGGCIYIMTNKSNKVLYVGVTSDLIARISEHRSKLYSDSFTAKYNITKLIYYENFHSIDEAIAREKQIKGGSRQSKINLIIALNPEWDDLYDQIIENW